MSQATQDVEKVKTTVSDLHAQVEKIHGDWKQMPDIAQPLQQTMESLQRSESYLAQVFSRIQESESSSSR